MRTPTVSILILITLLSTVFCANDTTPTAARPVKQRLNRTVSQGPFFPRNASAFNLTIPDGLKLRALGVGLGTQNYSCSISPGVAFWKPLGAVAEVRDLTNYEGDPSEISKEVIRRSGKDKFASFPKLASHFFVPREPFPLPAFYFEKNADFVILSKVASMPAPHNATRHIMWLALKNVESSKGIDDKLVFRTNTLYGVAPPASKCVKDGDEILSRYSALYWFYH